MFHTSNHSLSPVRHSITSRVLTTIYTPSIYFFTILSHTSSFIYDVPFTLCVPISCLHNTPTIILPYLQPKRHIRDPLHHIPSAHTSMNSVHSRSYLVFFNLLSNLLLVLFTPIPPNFHKHHTYNTILFPI